MKVIVMKYCFVILCWLLFICKGLFLNNAYCGDRLLQTSMSDAIAVIRNSKENVSEREQKLLSLLSRCEKEKDKGIILAAIAKIYFQHGTAQAEKIVTCCSRAIQYPLEISEKCEIYVMWGEALEAMKRNQDTILSGDIRKTICTPYIKAMDLVLQYLKSEEHIPPPPVDKFDVAPNDLSYQKFKQKNEAQIDRRKHVMMQNNLLWYKQILQEKLAHFYSSDDLAALKTDVYAITQSENKTVKIYNEMKLVLQFQKQKGEKE